MPMENVEKKLQVLMFPWLAKGHILPFVELAKRLAHHGVKIIFLSTPSNISWISPLLLQETELLQIDLMELPLPIVEGLPEGAESTAEVPVEMHDALKIALDKLEKPFEDLLKRLSPDYVIYDFSQYWAATVAAKIDIPAGLFYILNAAFCSYALLPSRCNDDDTTVADLTAPPPGYPSSVIAWQPFEARYILGAYNGPSGEILQIHRCLRSMQGSAFIAIRSAFPIEGKFIRFLEAATGKAVVPVGLLAPEIPHGKKLSEQESFCLTWLDKQNPSSVLYVSFGSECFLSKEQICAMALGIEATGLPFLWVLRFPRFSDCNTQNFFDEKSKVSALLPEGFESRTRERGVVYTAWAPQLHILAHPSVGGFLSHSGWSSVVEAVKFGVKLVLLPLNGDQGINARLAAGELEVGVEVERQEDGSFTDEQIRTAVLKVMNDQDQARELKSKMSEMKRKTFGEDWWSSKSRRMI
ncbi:hypothetical protein SUGI_0646090 [Cryptomeria japonica]|nr:hypothetical protein SUGI_0646090 [Cryptomeria japonica]